MARVAQFRVIEGKGTRARSGGATPNADQELLEKLRTIQARRPRTARLFADMVNDVYRDITGGGR